MSKKDLPELRKSDECSSSTPMIHLHQQIVQAGLLENFPSTQAHVENSGKWCDMADEVSDEEVQQIEVQFGPRSSLRVVDEALS